MYISYYRNCSDYLSWHVLKKSILAFLLKFLHRKLGISRHKTYSILRLINYFLKGNKANIIAVCEQPNFDASDFGAKGYLYLSPDSAQKAEQLVAECCSLYSEKSQQYTEEYFLNNPKKRFLLTIDADESLLSKPGIREFLQSDYVLNHVSAYLKSPFVLSALRLWWSPTNDTTLSSQMYHLDEEDVSQLKLLINVTSVGDENGPFTFLSAQQSEQVLNDYPVTKRRYTDEEIEQSLSDYRPQSIMGQPGSGGFVDTSKCLHFGSRHIKQDRLVFMAQFLKADAPFLTKTLPLSCS